MTILQAEGSRSALAYIEEVDGFAQVPAASRGWTGVRFVSESFGLDINTFESQEIRSDRMTAAVLQGNRNPNGDIAFELGPNSHNLLLRHVLGGDWSTSGTAAPYTHEINGEAALPVGGLTVVKAFTDIPLYLTYAGCRVDSFALTIPQEGIVSGSSSVLAVSEATPGSVRPYSSPLVYPEGDPYEGVDAQVYVQPYDSSGSYSWTSSELLAVVTSAQFSITNTLDPSSFVLGSTSRYSIPVGRRRIGGSFNIVFKDAVEYNRYIAGTSLAMRVVLNSGAYSHTFDFPNIRYAGPKPTPAVAGEQGIRQDLPFQALRHANLGYDVKVTAVSDELIRLYT